jgi:hypothetical protein
MLPPSAAEESRTNRSPRCCTKTNRVIVLRWRGEGFLMCVEAATGYEEMRLSSRIRL